MVLAPPLAGVRVVEFEGLGPGPLAGRMLAGMGADVVLIARPQTSTVTELLGSGAADVFEAGKRRVVLDIKRSDVDRVAAMDLVAAADVLIEGLRPGVMERLGFGPADCARRNPRLVYGRMTGWGQSGPLAAAAGHDLNYVALSGLLSLGARAGTPPMVPPTAQGDAPGALGLAFGIVCALLEARASGRGRVVDAAIVDVAAMLGNLAQWVHAGGQLAGDRPSMFHDSPFYDVYECADGRFVTIGGIEPQFYVDLLQRLGLADVDPRRQHAVEDWPALKERFRAVFRSKSRDEWCRLLEGTDVCFAPVLTLAEAPDHPHNVARRTFEPTADGARFGAIAPRFLSLDAD